MFLSACSYNINSLKSFPINLSYALIEATTDVESIPFSQLEFLPYENGKIDFQDGKYLAVFRLTEISLDNLQAQKVVVIGYKYFNEVDYFAQDNSHKNIYTEKLYRLIPTKNRIFSSEKYVFNFDDNPILDHYFVINSHNKTSVLFKLVDKDAYIKFDNSMVVFFTLLYSVLFALLLMNIIYYLYIKDRAYLYYSIYIFSAINAIYWQENRMIDMPLLYFPILGFNTKLFYFIASTLLGYVFIYKFLKLNWKKKVSGKLIVIWIFYLFILLLAVVIFTLFNFDSYLISALYNYTVFFGHLLVLSVAYLQYRTGNRQAVFLFFSWLILALFSVFRVYYVLDHEPNHFWMQHSYEIGLVLSIFILGLGLADQALGFKKSRDRAKASYVKANKALFAETLINNFLYETKEEILVDNRVQNFIKHIESKFADMVMKYAPVENIIRLSYKSGICNKHNLLGVNKDNNFHRYYESSKDYIEEVCISGSVSSQIVINQETNTQVQMVIVPVSLNYSSEHIDHECLIMEVKPSHILTDDELIQLKNFIEKSLRALIDSKELKQITKHAQNVISEAEVRDKSMRIKDRFFANISHEFRTPLTLTISPLQDLQKQKNFLNTNGRYLVETALENAKELMDLVNKFLDVQKLESEKFPLYVSKVNMNKIIYSVIKKMINWSLDHEQTLTFNKIHEHDVYVYCDKKEVEKVISNLVSNAIKYSGVNSKISITLVQESSWIKVMVSDDGIGIPEDIQEKIFERYYQAENTKNLSEAGTGLGLPYIKDVMKLHRGNIELSSTENIGSEFCLWFRVGFSHYDYSEISGPEEKSQLNEKYDYSEEHSIEIEENAINDITTLLIVEDNSELRKYLSFKFKNSYKVIKARNGKVGLAKALKYLPDIIVSDIMMPEMDGIEMTTQLRDSKECKTIPIILLTAKSSNSDAIEGLEVGADDYITKPFDFDELKARVDRIILARKAIREDSSNYPSQFKQAVKSDFQEHLDEIIIKNIADKSLNVEKLAGFLYLDRSSLYRKIKAEFDMTPIGYIRKVRMGYAIELLRDKKLSVSETAYACGFDSLSYFSKQFKKTHGTSPSDVL
jgi:signal transduction histidine kinase/AraC-like DNA-binding protein